MLGQKLFVFIFRSICICQVIYGCSKETYLFICILYIYMRFSGQIILSLAALIFQPGSKPAVGFRECGLIIMDIWIDVFVYSQAVVTSAYMNLYRIGTFKRNTFISLDFKSIHQLSANCVFIIKKESKIYLVPLTDYTIDQTEQTDNPTYQTDQITD